MVSHPSPSTSRVFQPTDASLTPRRTRSLTVSALGRWKDADGEPILGEECWDEVSSGDGSGSASGSDSAYGTLDEAESQEDLRKRRKLARMAGKVRLRRREAHPPGAEEAWASHSAEVRADLFGLNIGYIGGGDSMEDLSEPPTPSAPSTAGSSRQSTPEPSECDFDLGLTSLKSLSLRTPPRPFISTTTTSLSRRHTLPRRKRVRSTSISVSFEAPPLLKPSTSTTALPSDTSLPSELELSPIFPTLSIALGVLTLLVSLSALALPTPIAPLPASPVHLLHPQSHPLVEYSNALLSPFLITPTLSSLALGVANLASLKALEEDLAGSGGELGLKTAGFVLVSAAIVGFRVLFGWLFGRILGWAHPEFLSTAAIHQVGSGLAPILLALCVFRTFSSPAADRSNFGPLSFHVAVIAANFSTPIEHGGTGLWWGLSAIVVGAIAGVLGLLYRSARSFTSPSIAPYVNEPPSPKRSFPHLTTLFTLLLLPFLMNPSSPPSLLNVDAAFSALHPSEPNLLTILLMTAPRPGNPDFLLQTIESWLGALPEPATPSSPSLIHHSSLLPSSSPNFTLPSALDVTSRLRLIVYTHFRDHQTFDEARAFFTTSPSHAGKAAKYIEWRRDPRADSNRLDQRLHVARGLSYAANTGGESAYVMLTEDDFPLCSDEGKSTWASAWSDLQRALVATNVAMPDRSSLDGTATSSGHCGLFIATGGSGLAIRGFIASRLPAILLGAHDAEGVDRDARAARGDFQVKHEDEGADTPDLVIQDCLRGKIEGCQVCAPTTASSHPLNFPTGSKRNPGGVLGDRWGKSGLAATETLMQRHLGYNASTLPGRKYGKEEWACGWRHPFNGEPDVLVV